LPGPCLPELDGAVPAGRGQPPAVGAERHIIDISIVPGQSQQLLALPHVPDPDGRVAAGRGQSLAVGAERQALDLIDVPQAGDRLPARPGVADDDSPIHATDCESGVVGTKPHAAEAGKRFTAPGQLAGRDVPDGYLFFGNGGESFPTGVERDVSDGAL